jgi:hypothetical protein
MAFWLGGVTVFAVTFATAAIRGKMEPIPALLVPLVMLLFGIALTSGSFWLEANKTKPAIIELLKGKERKPACG